MLRLRAVTTLAAAVLLLSHEAWAQRPLATALADPQVQADVFVDATPNVTGRIRGRSGKALVFVSTLDDLATVAAHQLNGGVPNVNQGIGRAVDRILQLPHPERHKADRVVVNVAMLQSGAVYNHKPESGWFSLDVRSLDGARVEEVEAEVRTILAGVTRETSIGFEMTPFQMTPGGQIPGLRDSALVTTAAAISRHLGYEAQLGNAGSANLNVPLGQGSVAIGIGGNRGGQRGFVDEWGDIPQMMRTAKYLVLLAATIGR